MRKLLEPLKETGVENFVDDLFLLIAALTRLKEVNLTARLTKCEIGCAILDFLGHRVGRGEVAPTDAKIRQLSETKWPRRLGPKFEASYG